MGGLIGMMANEVLHRRQERQILRASRKPVYVAYLRHLEKARRIMPRTSHHPEADPPLEELELTEERDQLAAELELVASARVVAELQRIQAETFRLVEESTLDAHEAWLEATDKFSPALVEGMKKDLGFS